MRDMRDEELMVRGLPSIAYTEHPTEKKTVALRRGESGYCELDDEYASIPADELNKSLGVTTAQAEAMKVGSMFGWDAPGADPKKY